MERGAVGGIGNNDGGGANRVINALASGYISNSRASQRPTGLAEAGGVNTAGMTGAGGPALGINSEVSHGMQPPTQTRDIASDGTVTLETGGLGGSRFTDIWRLQPMPTPWKAVIAEVKGTNVDIPV